MFNCGLAIISPGCNQKGITLFLFRKNISRDSNMMGIS
jgi:hypothetical protein